MHRAEEDRWDFCCCANVWVLDVGYDIITDDTMSNDLASGQVNATLFEKTFGPDIITTDSFMSKFCFRRALNPKTGLDNFEVEQIVEQYCL